MKEIVTLQFGSLANSVAESFWNIQTEQLYSEELDAGVLLRRSSSVSHYLASQNLLTIYCDMVII